MKTFYTSEIRKELAILLRRIEYDIDLEENIERLHNLCTENMIFDDYLYDFIEQIAIHRERLFNILIEEKSNDDI